MDAPEARSPGVRGGRSVRSAALVYGEAENDLDDPAELFHQASKLYRSVVARQTRAQLLERHEDLRRSSIRAVKRRRHVPLVELPEPRFPAVAFSDVLRARRSERAFSAGAVSIEQVSALLFAAYGITAVLDAGAGEAGPCFRTVPSGGALYPLELDAFALRVQGLAAGRYHFDPLRRALEVIRGGDFGDALRSAAAYPDLVAGSSVVFVISAMFWRSRFKYGLRGYRFVLLEAGHVAQNLLLAATALGLGAVPLGGFFDQELDGLLELDGVNESALYAIAVGEPVEPAA